MATYTAATYAFDLSVTANYQTLWGDVDSKIQSLGGWTYVSQTGDGNPASTAPGSNGTFPAFRVYSTTSSGTTWYLRLDYGHDASGPLLKVNLGTSVNGSGVLGGQTGTQLTAIRPGAGNVSASQSLHISAATGRLMIFLGLSSNTRSSMGGISIHASVDTSGAANGGMEFYSGLNQTFTAQYLPVSGTVQPQQVVWPTAFGQANSQVTNSVTPLGIPQLWDSTGGNNPTLAGFVYATSDLTTNTTTTVSLYGSTRTYIVTPCNAVNGIGNNNAAFRFD